MSLFPNLLDLFSNNRHDIFKKRIQSNLDNEINKTTPGQFDWIWSEPSREDEIKLLKQTIKELHEKINSLENKNTKKKNKSS